MYRKLWVLPVALGLLCASWTGMAQNDVSSTVAKGQKTLTEIDKLLASIEARHAAVPATRTTVVASRTTASAPATGSPEALLSEINAWYSDQLKKARDEKKTPDFNALMSERTARAKKAVAGIDPAGLDPAKGLAWGQLFQSAGMQKEMLISAQRYVAQEPNPAKKYSGQLMVLTGLQAAEDAKGIVHLLGEMKPATAAAAASLASQTAGNYARTIADKLGTAVALGVIANQEAAVNFEELRKEEAKQAEARKAQPNQNAQISAAVRAFSQADATIYSIAQGRSSLLEKDGKKAEALAVLKTAMGKLGQDSTYAKSLGGKLKLAALPGNPAPDVIKERCYGAYSGLESLRGKVVVLDFTAHW